jgi:hypothetical protein
MRRMVILLAVVIAEKFCHGLRGLARMNSGQWKTEFVFYARPHLNPLPQERK